MAAPNSFAEHYKTISHTELLRILDAPDDYQPLAVEAARAELQYRNLSAEELTMARNPLVTEQLIREEKQKRSILLQEKVNTAKATLVDTLRPEPAGKISTEKTIRIFVLFFGCLFIYRFIIGLPSLLSYIKDSLRFPVLSLPFLLRTIVLPIALYLIWRRRKAGWVLFAIFLTYATVEATALLAQSIQWKPSNSAGLESLFQPPAITTCIFNLVLYGGALYILCKEEMRRFFSITNVQLITITGMAAAGSILLMMSLF